MQRILAPCRMLLAHRDFRVLLGCSLLLGLAYSFVIPFMSMFGTIEVGMSSTSFGLFMTSTSLFSIVTSTLLARWSDTHFSRRAMLILGSVCGALGYIGYAFVRDIVMLTLIGATILGISSMTFSQIFAHAREVVAKSIIPPNEAPLYMNVFRLFFALAWTVGPAMAAWVLVHHSYRGLFLAAAFCFILLLLVVIAYVPAIPPSETTRNAARASLWKSFWRRDLLAHFTGFVLIFASFTMAMVNLPLLILTALNGHEHNVAITYSLAPVFELPLMFYFGLLASRRDLLGIIRAGAVIGIVYYALITFVRVPWHIYPLQILSAAMVAISSGVAISFFQNYLPDQAGTATNLYSSASRIGSTIGYLLSGLIADGFGYRFVFVVCTAFCTAALALLMVNRRKDV